ncbi:hypothetical protein BWI93_05290 [Siphonobacter sp. BAB-5385]|nr:hypothetical protein BWI93_05290 [Siphonobacter sp. BAB-5385]
MESHFPGARSIDPECPDVLGFRSDNCVVIECKVSRSDFLADRKKKHRQQGGMGRYRIFCVPKGLIKAEELPERWLLLEVTDKGICYPNFHPNSLRWYMNTEFRTKHEFDCRDLRAEMRVMYMALSRLTLRGLFESIYEPFNPLD